MRVGDARLGRRGVGLLDNHLLAVRDGAVVMVVVFVMLVVRVVAVAVNGVQDTIGCFVKTVAKTVVVSFVVVISHVTLVLGRVDSRPRSRRLYSNLILVRVTSLIHVLGTGSVG